MLAVICAMWAAVWLSDGNEASAKERAARCNHHGACIGDADSTALDRRGCKKKTDK